MRGDNLMPGYDDFESDEEQPTQQPEKRRKFDQPARGPAVTRPASDKRVVHAAIAPVDATEYLIQNVPGHVRDVLGEKGMRALQEYLVESDMDYDHFSKAYGDIASRNLSVAISALAPRLHAWAAPLIMALAPPTPTTEKQGSEQLGSQKASTAKAVPKSKKTDSNKKPDFVPEKWAPVWEPLCKEASALNTGYSLGMASANLKYGLIKDIPKLKDTPEDFPVDVLRLIKTWRARLLNLKMGYKEAHEELRGESSEVQDAVWDALWFHIMHAIKNNQRDTKLKGKDIRPFVLIVPRRGATQAELDKAYEDNTQELWTVMQHLYKKEKMGYADRMRALASMNARCRVGAGLGGRGGGGGSLDVDDSGEGGDALGERGTQQAGAYGGGPGRSGGAYGGDGRGRESGGGTGGVRSGSGRGDGEGREGGSQRRGVGLGDGGGAARETGGVEEGGRNISSRGGAGVREGGTVGDDVENAGGGRVTEQDVGAADVPGPVQQPDGVVPRPSRTRGVGAAGGKRK